MKLTAPRAGRAMVMEARRAAGSCPPFGGHRRGSLSGCYPYSGGLRWIGRIDSRGVEAGLWSDEREGAEIVVRTRRVTAPAMNQGQAPRHAFILVGGRTKI